MIALLHNDSNAPINANELKSISALIAYVAATGHIHEDKVKHLLSATFHINAPSELPSAMYEDAVRLLVDYPFDQTVN